MEVGAQKNGNASLRVSDPGKSRCFGRHLMQSNPQVCEGNNWQGHDDSQTLGIQRKTEGRGYKVPFQCPLQAKPAWDSVVLGSLGMGFSVFLTFLSHPEHPQGWGRAQAGLGHGGLAQGVTLAGCHQSLSVPSAGQGEGIKRRIQELRGREGEIPPRSHQGHNRRDLGILSEFIPNKIRPGKREAE